MKPFPHQIDGAVFLANSYLTGRERQLANSPEGMVRVAVAAMPLAYGTDITADKVKFVNYPQASLPPGTYNSLAQLLPKLPQPRCWRMGSP